MSRPPSEFQNNHPHGSQTPSRIRTPPPTAFSPPPPLSSEPLTPKTQGWAQTAQSPIGLLDETGENSPVTASPENRNSIDLAVHHPIAQRPQSAHTDIPEAMSAEIYDDGNDWESVHSVNQDLHNRASYTQFQVNLNDQEYPESSYELSEEEEALDAMYEQHIQSQGTQQPPIFSPITKTHHHQPSRDTHYEEYESEHRGEQTTRPTHSHQPSCDTKYDEYENEHQDNAQFIESPHWGRPHPIDPEVQEYANTDRQFDNSESVTRRLSRHSGFGRMDTHRSSTFPDNFKYVAPTNIKVTQENDPDGVYYPAPVPAQLKLPPILSHRNKNKHQLPTRKPRPKSMMKMGVPLQQEWEPSPIDHEIAFHPDHESDIDSLLVESDASSYATRHSDDESEYQQGLDSDDEYNTTRRRRARNPNRATAKKESWFTSAMYAVIGKPGDKDSKDTQLVEDQENVLDEFDSTAFMKYDPDYVRQEARRFESGGVYSGTHSGKKPTSLIEELEIRKLGRIRQKKGIVRDAMAAQQKLATQNKFAHPLDKEHQPTLLQLQHVAESDYNDRKRWHQEVTVRQKQERGDESLAQRRARRKAEKTPNAAPQQALATETLAQRRARIKAEKERHAGLIVQHSIPNSPYDSPVLDSESTPMAPAVATT